MISFSGIDCAGKSTQIELVYRELANRKCRPVIIHSRGGYTPLLELIKTIIRTDKGGGKAAHEEYREKIHGSSRKRKLLLWAAILDLGLYYGIWFRILELFGKTILADRYFWDSYIDFCLKYPEYPFETWTVWRFARAIYKKPAKSIIYTIPADLSMYRSALKNEPWPETLEMREIRISRYLTEIEKKRWDTVIDAQGDIASVFEETMKVIDCENQHDAVA